MRITESNRSDSAFVLYHFLEFGDRIHRIGILLEQFRYVQRYVVPEDYAVHDGFHVGLSGDVDYEGIHSPFLDHVLAGVHVLGCFTISFGPYEYGEVGLADVACPSFQFVVVEFGEDAVAGDFLGVFVELGAPAGGDALDAFGGVEEGSGGRQAKGNFAGTVHPVDSSSSA